MSNKQPMSCRQHCCHTAWVGAWLLLLLLLLLLLGSGGACLA
jgi:hypothetical protein